MSKEIPYKSPMKKLLKFFENSRDNWKAKAQTRKKENKRLKNRVRFLEASQKKWRKEALALRRQLNNVQSAHTQATTDTTKKKSDTFLTYHSIPNHTYSAEIIFFLLQLVLHASVSFRGSEKVLKLIQTCFPYPLESVPSWYSVRTWFLRIGHYKLTCPKVIADDWCWILDHTIQLGKTKCLLILGIQLSQLPTKGKALSHQDLEAIDLFPVETSTGEIVYQQLEATCAKTGVPKVVISDNGSDLKKGIELFCHEHEETIALYDIKHKTACLLKASLEKDEDWLAFRKRAAQTRNQLQQTCLSHLKAPNQRSKARYMNIDILVSWAKHTLTVIEQTDHFSEEEKKQLPKLTWLNAYKTQLIGWDESQQVMTLTEQWVRTEGIKPEGVSQLKKQFQKELPKLTSEKAIQLKSQCIDFIHMQENLLKDNLRLPGSSEVIESVFGKQKHIERDYAKEGFTSLILGIGTLVGSMTIETVEKALSSTPMKTVQEWCKKRLGQTVQSKKIAAYSTARSGTKMGSVN